MPLIFSASRAFVLEVSNRYGIVSHKVRVTGRMKVEEMENRFAATE